jgi:hypothetical protein
MALAGVLYSSDRSFTAPNTMKPVARRVLPLPFTEVGGPPTTLYLAVVHPALSFAR